MKLHLKHLLFISCIFLTSTLMRGQTCSYNNLSNLAQDVYDAMTTSTALNYSTVDLANVYTCNNYLHDFMLDGPDIFSSLEDMIATAENEVLIAFGGWDPDCEATQAIIDGLEVAQWNASLIDPLRVKIVIDGKNTDWNGIKNQISNSSLFFFLVNLDVYSYEHTAFGDLHDKYVIVDREKFFTTGANPEVKHNSNYFTNDYNDDNGFIPDPTYFTGPWRDLGFIFHGTIANSAFDAFEYTMALPNIDHEYHFGTTLHFPFTPTYGTYGNLKVLAATKTREPAWFSNQNYYPLTQAWIELIQGAQSEINVITPNLSDDDFKDQIADAVKRGVTVNLVTGRLFNVADGGINNLGQGGTNLEAVSYIRERIGTAHPNADLFNVRWYSLDNDRQIYQNSGKQTHAKYFSVDGIIVVVGSGNQDTQSWNHSQEFNVLIDDPSTTALLDAQMFMVTWNTSNEAYIELYESNYALNEIRGIQSTTYNQRVSFSRINGSDYDEYAKNDEARSAIIYNTPACRKIRLYDNGTWGTGDDYVIIQTKQHIDRLVLNTFEQSFENNDIKVDYFHGGNLDGKVSSIWVSYSNICNGGAAQSDGKETVVKAHPDAYNVISGLDFDLFPNPVISGNAVSLMVTATQGSELAIDVYDSLGKKVYSSSHPSSGKEQVIQLDSEYFTNVGRYNIVVSSQGQQVSKPVIIVQ